MSTSQSDSVRALRVQAERARRLALGLAVGPDRDRLLEHARELEEQANKLEHPENAKR